MFDTKIAIILRNDLLPWQALNVTAFLSSGIVAENPEVIGEPYMDATKTVYHRLIRQPIIVLVADGPMILKIHERALSRGVSCAAYTEAMFATGNDEDNRTVFANFTGKEPELVGLALHADRKVTDKITKGAKMHP